MYVAKIINIAFQVAVLFIIVSDTRHFFKITDYSKKDTPGEMKINDYLKSKKKKKRVHEQTRLDFYLA